MLNCELGTKGKPHAPLPHAHLPWGLVLPLFPTLSQLGISPFVSQSGMTQKAPIKKCSKCHSKMPHSDEHSLCLLCLGEEHNMDSCHVVPAVCPQSISDKPFYLKAVLWEKAPSSDKFSKMTMPSTSKSAVASDLLVTHLNQLNVRCCLWFC